MKHELSPNAREVMNDRGINEAQVNEVLKSRNFQLASNGLTVFKKVITFNNGRNFLVYVEVDQSKVPPVVVTVHRSLPESGKPS